MNQPVWYSVVQRIWSGIQWILAAEELPFEENQPQKRNRFFRFLLESESLDELPCEPPPPHSRHAWFQKEKLEELPWDEPEQEPFSFFRFIFSSESLEEWPQEKPANSFFQRLFQQESLDELPGEDSSRPSFLRWLLGKEPLDNLHSDETKKKG